MYIYFCAAGLSSPGALSGLCFRGIPKMSEAVSIPLCSFCFTIVVYLLGGKEATHLSSFRSYGLLGVGYAVSRRRRLHASPVGMIDGYLCRLFPCVRGTNARSNKPQNARTAGPLVPCVEPVSTLLGNGAKGLVRCRYLDACCIVCLRLFVGDVRSL